MRDSITGFQKSSGLTLDVSPVVFSLKGMC
jgi:hypothetical protein